MGDTVSETSSNWPRDELEFVDELRQARHGTKDDSKENDESVSAAVSLVVSGARQGVVVLCASVARIMREKNRLQQRVAELEDQVTSLENSRSATISVTDCSTTQSQTTDTRSLDESPISQRCGSAPPTFITSALKYAKNDINTIGCCPVDSSRSTEGEGKLDGAHQRTVESRTSSVSMPETNSTFVRKSQFQTPERREHFHRGQSYASTRSLNIGGHLSSGNFVRRKYSTISLRRVRRRSSASKQAWSFNNLNSDNLGGTNLDQESLGRSCIVTVAEVHTEPEVQHPHNSENDAVKLLARTLTNMLQEPENIGNENHNETFVASSPSVDSTTSQSFEPAELSAPHPLAGCECVICKRLSSDPDCQLYALTTEEGALLPPGSHVLVRGDHVGTVLYLGHEKFASKQTANKKNIQSSEALHTPQNVSQDLSVRPVGVTIRLWPPDTGQMFVPLSAVICQLDDDQYAIASEAHEQEYEYLDEDSEDSSPSRTSITYDYPAGSPQEHLVIPTVVVHSNVEESTNSVLPRRGSHKSKDIPETPSRKVSLEGYFVRSPSLSSYNSESTQSLGDLSVYGLEYQEDRVILDESVIPEFENEKYMSRQRHSRSSILLSQPVGDKGENSKEIPGYDTPSLNTTFVCMSPDEEGPCNSKESECGSLYDTADSAISLTFLKRYKESLGSTEPSSMSDTDRDSPHFGDTWDSGCSMGRGRCKSDSSGQFSDMDSDSSRFGSTWARNLREALDSVLSKQQNSNNDSNYGCNNQRARMVSPRRKGKKNYGNQLDFFKSSSVSKIYIENSTTEHSQV